MHTFWEIVASNAVIVVALAAGVALLGRAWKNPSGLHLLWMLVLVKLFTPPLVTIGVPLPVDRAAPVPEPREAHKKEAPPPVVEAPVEAPAAVSLGARQARIFENGTVATSTDAATDAAAAAVEKRTLSWSTLLAWTWGLGIAVFAAGRTYHILRFQRQLQRLPGAGGPPPTVSRMAERIGRRLGLRRAPEILMVPVRLSPLVWSVGGRPRVILPVELFERLDPDAREALLAHELAHVRRKDHLVRLLELIATTLFWWHPVVWWASGELRELEEQCCDSAVLETVPHGARSYATALVDTLDFLSERPAAVPLEATAAKSTVSLARRIRMLEQSRVKRLTVRSALAVAVLAIVPMAVAFASEGGEPATEPTVETVARAPAKKATDPQTENQKTASADSHQAKDAAQAGRDSASLVDALGGKPVPPDPVKAELMGRVEWVMMHGGRDVTARKSIEWGDVEEHENGNRSIRYKYYGTIWDRDVYIMNQVFTFDPKGNPVSMRHVKGFPKKKEPKVVDTSTKEGMIELVEDFFRNNFRDITFRKTIEWGEPVKDDKGNTSIRYQYAATIWGKDKMVMNQIFTFDPKGKYVGYENVEGFPKKEPKVVDTSTKKGMIELVEDFFRNNFRDVTSRETIEWGEPVKDDKGNTSIRYKYLATIWGKDKLVMNQIFTFDPKGKYVHYKNVDGFPKKP